MASPMVEDYKVLVVTVKSATLETKDDKAKLYAYAYVQPKVKLRTKVHSTSCSNSTWDDKFVFSMPECSFNDQGSSIFFKIYKARWHVDSLVGVAKCDIKTLLGGFGAEKKDENEDEDEVEVEDEDPRYPNMFDCGENDDEAKKEIISRVSTSLEIMKGSEMKGVLNVELEVRGSIFCFGNFPWKNMAMPYDAFMGKQIQAKNEKKSLYWICFNISSETVID